MSQGLTSRLSKLLLIFVVCVASAPLSASEPNSISSGESARYLATLKSLYLTSSEREALFAHGNALLETYAMRADYQVGRENPRDIRYRLSAGAAGELLVREETRDADGGVAVRNRSLSVFGMDPYLQYHCTAQGLACVFRHPGDGAPWLTIARDPDGAEELAKALSYLFRNLQKG